MSDGFRALAVYRAEAGGGADIDTGRRIVGKGEAGGRRNDRQGRELGSDRRAERGIQRGLSGADKMRVVREYRRARQRQSTRSEKIRKHATGLGLVSITLPGYDRTLR